MAWLSRYLHAKYGTIGTIGTIRYCTGTLVKQNATTWRSDCVYPVRDANEATDWDDIWFVYLILHGVSVNISSEPSPSLDETSHRWMT